MSKIVYIARDKGLTDKPIYLFPKKPSYDKKTGTYYCKEYEQFISLEGLGKLGLKKGECKQFEIKEVE